MQVSFEAAKACSMIILIGIVFLIFLPFFRKRIKDLGIAAIPSLLLGFLSVLAFYDFSIFRYIEDTNRLLASLELGSNMNKFLLGAAFAVIGFILAYILSSRLEPQEYRSLFHAIPGLLLVYFALINIDICLLFLGICITLFMVGEYLRQSEDEHIIAKISKTMLNAALRGSEVAGYIASLFFLIGALIVILFIPTEFAIGSILILSLGDPSAVLVGKRFGKHKWNHNPNKSLEGSSAMFAIGTLALVIFKFNPLVAVVVTLSATLFESLPLKVSDNLIIPLISGMMMISLLG